MKNAFAIVMLFCVAAVFGQSLEVSYNLDLAPVVDKTADVLLSQEGSAITLRYLSLGNANNVECGCAYSFPEMCFFGTERAFVYIAAETYFAVSGAPVQAAAYLGGGLEYRPPKLDFIPIRLSLDFGCGRFQASAFGSDDALHTVVGMMSALRPKASVGWRISKDFSLFFGYASKYALVNGNISQPAFLSDSFFASIASPPSRSRGICMNKRVLTLILVLALPSAYALPNGYSMDFGLFYSAPAPVFYDIVYAQDPESGTYVESGYDYYSSVPVTAIFSLEKGLFSFGAIASEYLGIGRLQACVSDLELTPFVAISSRNMLYGAVDVEAGIGADLGWMYASVPGYVRHGPEERGFCLNGVNWGFTNFLRVDIRLFKGSHFSAMMKNRSIFTDNTACAIGDFGTLPVYNFGISYSLE